MQTGWPISDTMSQIDIRARTLSVNVLCKGERRMVQAELCKIALVIRTIGAERGRAARGRP